MEKRNLSWNVSGKILLLIMFVLMIGVGYAADDWANINSEDNSNGQNGSVNDVNNSQSISDNPIVSNDGVNGSGPSNVKYTRDFYTAIVLGVLGILLVGLFIYLFIRGPRNKWNKK